MIKLSHKKKRVFIGMLMFYSFITLCIQLAFYVSLYVDYSNEYNSIRVIVVILMAYWYFYTPAVFSIILSYILLMKVYKYKEVDNNGLENNQVSEVSKFQEMQEKECIKGK